MFSNNISQLNKMSVTQNGNENVVDNVASTRTTNGNKTVASNTALGVKVKNTVVTASSRATGPMPSAKRAFGDIINADCDVFADPFTTQGNDTATETARNDHNTMNTAKRVHDTDGSAIKTVFAPEQSRLAQAGKGSTAKISGRPAPSTTSPTSTVSAPRRTSERLAERLAVQRAHTAAEASSSSDMLILNTNRLGVKFYPSPMTPIPVKESASDHEILKEGTLTPCSIDVMPNNVLDIDVPDHVNHLMVEHFSVRIQSVFLEHEVRYMVDPSYMVHQKDITVEMRAILVDWLVDVHGKFKLRPETLFLAVNIIDRYLSCSTIVRRKLQLVGLTAMLIASKYEEVHAPKVADFMFISHWEYKKWDVLAMEADILNRLDFDLMMPCSVTFMNRLMKACHTLSTSRRTHEYLTQYLVELSLVDSEMLRFRPSMISAAACHVAGKLCCREFQWDSTLTFHSGGYTVLMLEDCEKALRRLLQIERNLDNENKLSAVKRKFLTAKFNHVSGLINMFWPR